MKRIFISFADQKFAPSLARIGRQAYSLAFFDEIRLLTEKDLPTSFRQKYRNRLTLTSRGYGYWIWKPYIILATLQYMNDGDQLLYLDAGCHFNNKGKARLHEYFNQLSTSETKIAAFSLPNYHNEIRWTKMDLLVKLGVQNDEKILTSAQIASGHVFIQKCQTSLSFVEQWMELVDNAHLVDDSPSVEPNFSDFKEHRHDQSIFSLLCKTRGALIFPATEVYPYSSTGITSWESLAQFPIHDRRDKEFSQIGYIRLKFAQLVKKIGRRLTKLITFKH